MKTTRHPATKTKPKMPRAKAMYSHEVQYSRDKEMTLTKEESSYAKGLGWQIFPVVLIPCRKPSQARALVKAINSRSIERELVDIFPTNWCDPLLTGKDAPNLKTCPGVELFVNTLKQQLIERLKALGLTGDASP